MRRLVSSFLGRVEGAFLFLIILMPKPAVEFC
jgi:hypothetical protein